MSGEPLEILRDLLERKDPHGYYVIPAKIEALEIVRNMANRPGVILVEYADMLIIKTRSRSMAEKFARALARRGLLAEEE
ncbi:MAG: hypothetical protein F7C35_04065 [Desulfurococcales archaeon]|nr:hypothetical protein [Desulfurococcales archaeon]